MGLDERNLTHRGLALGSPVRERGAHGIDSGIACGVGPHAEHGVRRPQMRFDRAGRKGPSPGDRRVAETLGDEGEPAT